MTQEQVAGKLGFSRASVAQMELGNRQVTSLELGDGPIGDLADLMERQGIRMAAVSLPDDISGITVQDPEAGVFVAVNKTHSSTRQRFSMAHEYAHVLLDSDGIASIVSRGGNRTDLSEIRANAFAAVFLMPERGRDVLSRAWARDNPGAAKPGFLMKPM